MNREPVEKSDRTNSGIRLTEIAIPIVVIHLLALVAFLPAFISWPNIILFGITLVVFSQGITLGYHRLLAHSSLRVPKWLEYFYVGLALCCLQESPGKWVSTHRRHHHHSDDHDDPHSPQESFFWSHIGWLLFRRPDGMAEFAVDEHYASDIISDPFYAALERHPALPGALYLIQAFVVWLLATLVYAWTGQPFSSAAFSGLGTMLWTVVLRTVIVWHFSWSVNSLTHRFGYKNYQTSDDSRNNWLVAMVSNGEGWHNNHHHDPASASNQHRWWEFDVTWYHIRLLEILGLATHVVRPRYVRHAQRASQQAKDGSG